MQKCLVCGGSNIKEILSFESYPLCIGVVPKRLKDRLKSFPLKIGICGNCTHVQQLNGVEDKYREMMYSADSAELLSSVPTPSRTEIGRSEAKKCFDFFMSCGLPKSGKVVDIGCYDGYFLSLVKAAGFETLGVEPNPAGEIAEEKWGIKIIKEFFTGDSFKESSVDIFVLRNILEHIVDLDGFLGSIEKALKPGGHLIIEVPNMFHHLNLATLGCFFHQHLSYFTLYTMLYLLSSHSMEYVSSLEEYALYLCATKTDGKPKISGDAKKVSRKEIDHFIKKYEDIKSDLQRIVDKSDNAAVFGAGGHTAGLLYLLGKKYVDRIKHVYDNNPMKHGNYMADFASPVKGADLIKTDKPDLIIISSGLHQDDILKQLDSMNLNGADVAVIYPKVEVLKK